MSLDHATRPAAVRGAGLPLERKNGALDLMQAENGKARRDAFLEVTDIAIATRYYARSAAKLLAPKRRRGAIPVLTHTTELHHPKGVVAVVSPSGLGRRHGADGMLKYTEAETVAHQRVLGFSAPTGFSESAWASTLTVVLKGMKRLGAR